MPLSAGAYTAEGILAASTASAIQAAANSLWVTNGTVMRVWHRPVPDPNNPDVPLKPGSDYAINSSTVPTKVAVLKSRRD